MRGGNCPRAESCRDVYKSTKNLVGCRTSVMLQDGTVQSDYRGFGQKKGRFSVKNVLNTSGSSSYDDSYASVFCAYA